MPVIGLLLLLAACAAPSPKFYGVEPSRYELNENTYNVYVKEGSVQVVRTGWLKDTSTSEAKSQMIAFAEKASSCKIDEDSVTGDAAIISADLDC